MKKLIFLKILLVYNFTNAQVNENMLLERFNMNAFNPAFTGVEGRGLSFTNRNTNSGVAGAPKLNYFYYNGNHKNNLAFGFSVIDNKVFIDQRTMYTLDASYKIQVSGEQIVYLGVKGGVHTKFTDVDAIQRLPGVPANPAIPEITKETYPVIGFGFLYKLKSLYFSASVPNFLNPKNYTDDISFIGSQKPSTYLLAGATIPIGVFNSTFNPYLSQKIVPGIGNTTHFGGTIDYKGIIEFGGGYKSTNYFNVMAILSTKIGLSIGYGYDFRGEANDVEVQKTGTEIFLKYNF